MKTKNLIAAAIVSVCASVAFAANTTPQVDFTNTMTPYEVTAQAQTSSAGSDAQAKNAGAGEQSNQAVNFANSMQPWEVTAQTSK
ncbi:hypothetical protein EDC30_105206 [Paucimonas lemoignei]|uniref:Secreted protein n=2 Tax=Paucimonas lemoignei TaxID=29443 RepID=A0A4R3HW32_PAULE|nr:hypothetical protein EDC30_105206 [Paucimonas lemoignei]